MTFRIAPNMGTPQDAIITTSFPTPLEATVTNPGGHPMAGVTVTFVAPTSGPSGTFAGLPSVQVLTGSNGVAVAPSFTANSLAGPFVLTASIPGVTTKADFVLTNDQAPTSTVVIGAASNLPGAPATFTAIVSSSFGIPTGPVEFFDNNVPLGFASLALIGGLDEASFSTPSLPLGPHSITAQYLGDNNFLPSTSPPLIQSVGGFSISPATLKFTLTTNGTVFLGSGVPFNASETVSGGINPIGTITFTLTDPNGILVYTDVVTVIGDGTYTTATGTNPGGFLPTVVGTYQWLTLYQGTGNSARQFTTITTSFGTPLATTVTDAAGNPVAGVTVTFVAPSSGPSGTFANGSTTVQVLTDSNGVAVAPAFTANDLAGSYVVTASVAGAAAPANFALINFQSTTITVVSSDINPSLSGQPVTFTAIVTPHLPSIGNPTGQVEFFDGSTPLGFGTLTVVNGVDQATFTTSSLTLGEHLITAQYLGDNKFFDSVGALIQTVGVPTILTVGFGSTVTGQDATITANVAAATTGAPVTVGAVQFAVVSADGNTLPLGTVNLDVNGFAQLTVNNLLPPGSDIVVSYLGIGDFLPSTVQFFQIVNPADTMLTLTAASPTVVAGQPDNLTVALDPVPPGAFVVDPTGTLSLFSSFNGGVPTLLAQIPVGGSAIFPVFTVPGTYDLFVTFDTADSNFNSSTSPSITITVL